MGRAFVMLSGLAFLALALFAGVSEADEGADQRGDEHWAELLGESQAELPEPRTRIEWIDSVDEAFRVARKEKRPIFATLM